MLKVETRQKTGLIHLLGIVFGECGNSSAYRRTEGSGISDGLYTHMHTIGQNRKALI